MQFLNGIKKLKNYNFYLIDQWGVIHDGQKKFKHAYKTLLFLKKFKKKLIIISNSSENSKSTINNTLKKLKINENIFDKIVTSGDLFEKEIEKFKKNFKKKILKCYCISQFSKKKLLEKYKITTSSKINKTDFILASSIKPDCNINNIKKKLDICIKKRIPMICTNPDKIVFNGKVNKLVAQVGVLADYYKKKGGKVKFYGKPYPKIYREALNGFKNLSIKKVLMIGDSLENDILGAQNLKIDTLFITNGNHKNEFLGMNKKQIKKKIITKWKKINPSYVSKSLNL